MNSQYEYDYYLNLERSTRDFHLRYWLQEEVFTPSWWLILGITVTFVIATFFLIDRSRKTELLLFGSLAAIIAMVFDVAGTRLMLWAYPIKLFPVVPPLFPFDLVLFPCSYLLLYQRYSNFWPFLLGAAAMAAFFALVLEPFLVKMKIYQPLEWEYVYSLPIYVLIALFVRMVIRKVSPR